LLAGARLDASPCLSIPNNKEEIALSEQLLTHSDIPHVSRTAPQFRPQRSLCTVTTKDSAPGNRSKKNPKAGAIGDPPAPEPQTPTASPVASNAPPFCAVREEQE
jgi:hypothetical protein